MLKKFLENVVLLSNFIVRKSVIIIYKWQMQQLSKLRQNKVPIQKWSFDFVYQYLQTLIWEQLYSTSCSDWFHQVLKSSPRQRFKKEVSCSMGLGNYWKITLQRHPGKCSSTGSGYFVRQTLFTHWEKGMKNWWCLIKLYLTVKHNMAIPREH